MQVYRLKLINNKKEFFYFALLLLGIFFVNIFFEYKKYQYITKYEVHQENVNVENIYKKNAYYVVKFKSSDLTFYSKLKNVTFKKDDTLKVLFISKYLSFYDYLKGFYSKVLDIEKVQNKNTFREEISSYIASKHENILLQELFNALFLAKPISKELRELCTDYGISHLIAISGYHLGLLSACIYFILHFFYSFFHQRYFNYRNKKFDVLVLTAFIMLIYLLFTNIVPSLLRSFIMYILGIYFLRRNIKLLSFNTLFLTLVFIIASFPKYLFTLSLWFSILGVFYIFLFIKYFKNIPKFYALLLFNFWIFFAINPIIHYFFDSTTYLQLFSPLITIVFTLFYPIQLILHIFDLPSFLDNYLLFFFSFSYESFTYKTSIYFFLFYLLVSFLAVLKKEAFYYLNLLFILYNLYIFMK